MENQQKPAEGEARQGRQYEEELEINLADYVRVVWRRKKPISAIFIMVIIAALVISFIMPKKVYESSALIALAKVQNQFIETPETIISIFKQESVLRGITQKMGLSEVRATGLANQLKFSKSGDLIEVKAKGSTPEESKQLVETVVDIIIEREQKIVAQFKPDVGAEIDFLREKIKTGEAEMAEIKAKIRASEKATSEGQGRIVATYIEELNRVKTGVDVLQTRLIGKERELNFQTIEPKIEVPVVLPQTPLETKKNSNIIIGAILGLSLGIFYAFVAEYLEKNKAKITA